jgi:hypothetical protein
VQAAGNGSISAEFIAAHGTHGHGSINGQANNSFTVANPFASLTAPPIPSTVQSTSTFFITSSTTLQPGLYIGGINISGDANIVLVPGLYYLEGGGFTVTGQASVTDNGQGVMIYNAPVAGSDSIDLSSQGAITLSGLSATQLATLGLSNPGYVGLAIFQDPSSKVSINISGGEQVAITGSIYAAGASVNVSGSSNLNLAGDATRRFGAHLIAFDLLATGNASVSVDTSDNEFQTL